MGPRDKSSELWDFLNTHQLDNSIVRKIVLSEFYDESYNLCQHNDSSKPLSQVRYHENETYKEASMEYKKLKEFANLQIGKFFNLSFFDYIQLPLSTHSYMSKIAIDLMKKTNTLIEDFKSEIEP